MTHITYSDLRRNMARYLDQAVTDREPIMVTRSSGKGNVVLISEEEFAGWQATAHLLGSPANAARLIQAAEQVRAGVTREHAPLPAKPR